LSRAKGDGKALVGKKGRFETDLEPIIFLSGVDGSGKTTLATSLVKALENKGLEANYVWYRWTAFFSYPLLALCRALGYTKRNGYLVLREYHRNGAIATLWAFLYPLDYVLCSLAKIRTMRKKNSVTVFDRFVPDIIADVIFQTRINILKNFVGKILLYHLKRENFLGIILDVNEEVAISRKDDIPYRNYVEFRRPIYRILAHMMGWRILDGCRPVEENVRKILEMIDLGSKQIHYCNWQ